MEIRPRERDALIFSASARQYGEDCLILDMNEGRLELRYVPEYFVYLTLSLAEERRRYF